MLSVASSFIFVIIQDVVRSEILSKNCKGNCENESEKIIHISEKEEQTLYSVE